MGGAGDVIVARDLSKRYSRSVLALDSVTFSLAPDRTYGLLGRNGAGKTTLLSLLCGFIYPTQGSISIYGHKPGLSYQRVGFVSERPHYHPSLTVGGLLHRLAALRGVPLGQRRSRCDTVLRQVGLETARSKRLSQLSKGMLQRFSIAQCLLGDPDLVILDEPMSGLDPVGQKELRDLIVAMRRPGRTIIFSSHLLYHLEKVCDGLILLDEGTVRYDGPATGTHPDTTKVRVSRPLTASENEWLLRNGARVVGERELEIRRSGDGTQRAVLSYLLACSLTIERLEKGSDLETLFLDAIGGR